MIGHLTPAAAAAEYFRLDDAADPGAAIRFAMRYEEEASDESYAEYLAIVDGCAA